MMNIKQNEKNETAASIFDTFSFLFLFPSTLSEKYPQKKNETMVINANAMKIANEISNTLLIVMQSF